MARSCHEPTTDVDGQEMANTAKTTSAPSAAIKAAAVACIVGQRIMTKGTVGAAACSGSCRIRVPLDVYGEMETQCAMRPLTLVLALTLVAAPLAHAERPEADRKLDAARKPAAVLDFAGVRQGTVVGEYMPGRGYFTRVLAEAVGKGGWVHAYVPEEIVRIVPDYLVAANAIAAEHPNVTVRTGSTGAYAAGAALDVVLTVQNYHDLHTRYAPPNVSPAFNASVFKALKPGGLYVIVDHRAPVGSGTTLSDRQHRIDPDAVRREVEAAGFVFDAASEILANPADARTVSVFDPSVRGATDQFALRFRKP
jgi:predicted methyltransferase